MIATRAAAAAAPAPPPELRRPGHRADPAANAVATIVPALGPVGVDDIEWVAYHRRHHAFADQVRISPARRAEKAVEGG